VHGGCAAPSITSRDAGDQGVNLIFGHLEQQFVMDLQQHGGVKPAMAAGIRIMARRMTSAAVPWMGALIAARLAKPAPGPLALISGVWILRPNRVWT
jgi:hypothetical protein